MFEAVVAHHPITRFCALYNMVRSHYIFDSQASSNYILTYICR